MNPIGITVQRPGFNPARRRPVFFALFFLIINE